MKSINKKIIISGICYVSPLLLLLVVFFSCSIAFADSFESSVGVAFTLNPTVTISITGGTGATNDGLTIANLTPGDVKDSNIITVSATANTPLGYTLGSTVGNSTYNSTELRKDGTSTANKFTNLTSNISSLSNFSDNTWGYSYSTDSGSTWISGDITSTTNTGYNGLPIYTTSSPIKLINSNTAGSSSIQFKIGAKASSTQIAGTYNNIINFIGTGKIVTTEYTINYHDPSGEAESMPSQQHDTESVGTGAVAISSTQPTRSGYLFKGWCTSQVADDAECPTNDTLIQPGGLLALDPGTSSATATVTKDLYAIWKDSKLYLQNASLADCGKTMYDKRDSGTETAYTTAMIGDTCWMTTNLNLAGGTALSADDTDVTSSYISSFTTSNNLTKSGDTIVLPTSTTSSGFNTDNYSYVANSGNASSDCSSAPGCYSYYSWDAATLGSGRTIATDNTNAEQSICPKGWHLPNTRTGTDDTSDFRKLMIALGGSSSIQTYNSSTTPTGATMSSALQASPNNFLLAGLYSYGSFGSGGSRGGYWSSTSYSNNSRARGLLFDSSIVASAEGSNRRMGYSVRCVKRPPKPMQEFTASDCSAMSTGETVDLVDSRDGEEYKVGKLADGNCWMLDNLRLDLTNSTILNGLTTSNTHVDSASLTSLKSGNRSAGAQYASSGFVKWDSSSSSNVYNQAKANADYKDTTTTSYGAGSGKIGVYYNLCAASAGSYCYDENAGTGSASYDLCPAGWRMPTGGPTREYQELFYTVYSGDVTSFINALSTPLSGEFFNGYARSQGTRGYFWSSTDYDASVMFTLYVESNYVKGNDRYASNNGFSVRCLLGS